MPIKGKILYPFRWFWRQDISTQILVPVSPVSHRQTAPPPPAPTINIPKK
jgi:hypothetical protein